MTDTIEKLAEIGYGGIALTLDRGLLNPFAPRLDAAVAEVKSSLANRRMRAVVETGARFLLDSHVKHEPTLVSPAPADRARRVDFLRRAIDITGEIGAECVSLWSGRVRDGASEDAAFDRLTMGLKEVLDYATTKNTVVAFEPEPEMFIDTMDRYSRLLEELRYRGVDLSHLRLTIDVGHLHCQSEVPIANYLRRWGDQIANIHIEDMRAGVHEHLMFGEGEIAFPPVIAALADIGYTGLVNVELSRHRHEGLEAARRSYEFLRSHFDRFNSADDLSNP